MLNLTKDELLVLFDWAHRFCETECLAFSHYAEVVVIDKIAGQLERTLSEPFDCVYPRLLTKARKRVLAAYEEHMRSKSWIHDQSMKQS